VAYNATVVLNVPGGTNVGNISLLRESGALTAPATLQGNVTAANGTVAGTIDAAVTAQQEVKLPGGGTLLVAIPVEPGSVSNIAVNSTSTCTGAALLNANCGEYKLVVPASNPQVGVLSNGSISLTPPAAGSVAYTVRADAFVPMSGGAPTCSPNTQTTNLNSVGTTLLVTSGATTQVKQLDFSGCS
jgi:hypothetical protein